MKMWANDNCDLSYDPEIEVRGSIVFTQGKKILKLINGEILVRLKPLLLQKNMKRQFNILSIIDEFILVILEKYEKIQGLGSSIEIQSDLR